MSREPIAQRPKLNAEWHRAHPMPKNPTLTQRIAWHREHAQNCGCRPIPPKLQEEIQRLEVAGTQDPMG